MDIVDVITLEDGQSYMVADEILIDNVKYVYLANEDDISKFCIRKVNVINDDEYLVGLSSKEEFQKALQEFINKQKNI